MKIPAQFLLRIFPNKTTATAGGHFDLSKSTVKFHEERLMKLLTLGKNGKMDRERLYEFMQELLKLQVKLHPTLVKQGMPTLTEKESLDDPDSLTIGEYSERSGTISYALREFIVEGAKVVTDESKIIKAIDIIGHEGRHYGQYDREQYLKANNEPAEFQRLKYVQREEFDDYYPDGFEEFLDLYYTGEVPQRYVLSMGEYLARDIEIDARNAGAQFVEDVYAICQQSEYASKSLKQWFKVQIQRYREGRVEAAMVGAGYMRTFDRYKTTFTIDNDILLKAEADRCNFRVDAGQFNYKKIYFLAIRNKDPKQLKELLLKCIEEGYTILGNAILDAMQRLDKFVQSPELDGEFKSQIVQILSSGAIKNDEGQLVPITQDAYEIQYNGWLSDKDIARAVLGIFSTGKLNYGAVLLKTSGISKETFQSVIAPAIMETARQKLDREAANPEESVEEEEFAMVLSGCSYVIGDLSLLDELLDPQKEYSHEAYRRLYGDRQVEVELKRFGQALSMEIDQDLDFNQMKRIFQELKTSGSKEFAKKQAANEDISYFCGSYHQNHHELKMLSYLVYEVFVQAFIQNFYPTKEELEKFKTNLLVYLANEHMLVPRPASMLTRDEVLDYYAKNLDLIQSKISPDQFSAKEMKVMKQHIAQQLEKLSWGFALRRDYKYGSFGE